MANFDMKRHGSVFSPESPSQLPHISQGYHDRHLWGAAVPLKKAKRLKHGPLLSYYFRVPAEGMTLCRYYKFAHEEWYLWSTKVEDNFSGCLEVRVWYNFLTLLVKKGSNADTCHDKWARRESRDCQIAYLTNAFHSGNITRNTGMGEKVVPRLRESQLLAPSGRRG